MSIRIVENIISQNAFKFEMKLNIVKDTSIPASSPAYSSKIDINDRIVFQAMFFDIQSYTVQCFMKFTKKRENDKLNYRILLSNRLESDTSKVVIKEFTTDDSWHSLGDNISINHVDYAATYIIQLETEISAPVISYKTIYEDTDHTDFELRGVDGSVRMHKVIASACSSFFKTLFTGTWQETAEGVIHVPETSVTTLQCLKDYIYLGKVPETDLKQVLLLSSYYMIEDLEMLCSYALSKTITAENICDLTEFALKHKQYQLLTSILQLVSSGGFNIDEFKALYKIK